MNLTNCLPLDEIIEIECDQIATSPYQPRKNFSVEELEELSASIKTVGIIHPPVVRRIVDKESHQYELVAGERRWRAAQQAGLKKIKVIVRSSSNEKAAQSTLIENIQRVDLDPIEMALAFKKLIECFGMTQEELALKVGKKRSTLANYLRLLTLPSAIQENLSSGKLSVGHAKVILSLTEIDRQLLLHERILKQGLTVRQSEEVVFKWTKKNIKKNSKKDIHCADLELKLQEYLGTKTIIAHKGPRGGHIEIHYHNLDDLDRILEKLGITID